VRRTTFNKNEAQRILHEPFPEALASIWTRRGFRAHIVNYADDFVILSRGHAEEAVAWTTAVMTKLGLKLNEAKTSVKDSRRESFESCMLKPPRPSTTPQD
jgi:hypothetical protein